MPVEGAGGKLKEEGASLPGSGILGFFVVPLMPQAVGGGTYIRLLGSLALRIHRFHIHGYAGPTVYWFIRKVITKQSQIVVSSTKNFLFSTMEIMLKYDIKK